MRFGRVFDHDFRARQDVDDAQFARVARDDVEVEVGDGSAGGLADVAADVETAGIIFGREDVEG